LISSCRLKQHKPLEAWPRIVLGYLRPGSKGIFHAPYALIKLGLDLARFAIVEPSGFSKSGLAFKNFQDQLGLRFAVQRLTSGSVVVIFPSFPHYTLCSPRGGTTSGRNFLVPATYLFLFRSKVVFSGLNCPDLSMRGALFTRQKRHCAAAEAPWRSFEIASLCLQ